MLFQGEWRGGGGDDKTTKDFSIFSNSSVDDLKRQIINVIRFFMQL